MRRASGLAVAATATAPGASPPVDWRVQRHR
jgi:hypothetical protein